MCVSSWSSRTFGLPGGARRKVAHPRLRRLRVFDIIVSSVLQWGVPKKERLAMKRIMVAMMLVGAALGGSIEGGMGGNCQLPGGSGLRGHRRARRAHRHQPAGRDGQTARRRPAGGLYGADEMYGDTLEAEGNGTSTDGDDELIGYRGHDTLFGFGAPTFCGAVAGRTLIDATEESDNPGEDTVRGSRDQDSIDAVDGFKDTIFCGRGVDEVFFDKGWTW